MNFLTELFNNYGYIVLFLSLALELIAFPTPGETLMTYCGFLVFQGRLNWGISIIVAALGVISGITISYFIGHSLGTPFLKKYGSYIHFEPEKLDKTSKWFEKYGNGILVVAYFIPGIRHITGYFSGITKIPFKKFALNAYIGAFIWTATFISLGKILGSNWENFHGSIKKYLIIGGIILAVALLCIYIYRNYKIKIKDFTIRSLEKLINIFHSLGKLKVAIVGIAVIFIALSIVVIGLIQDFLANEFNEFDTIATYLVTLIFSENFYSVMSFFKLLTSTEVLIILGVSIFVWIMYKSDTKFLEIRFFISTILGGELLEEVLRIVFHRLGPAGLSIIKNVKYTFPSEQTLMSVVIYGFLAFIVFRYTNKRWLWSIVTFISLGICFVTGLSIIFFQVQYPSDVIAGYAFGGLWLSLNIILLEVFRVLPKISSFKLE